MSKSTMRAAATEIAAFGLEGTNWEGSAEAFVEHASASLDVSVRWHVCARNYVQLSVTTHGLEVVVRVEPHIGSLDWRDAMRASTVLRHVADVAQRVEEAIAKA